LSLVYIDGFEWIENNAFAFGGPGRWTYVSGSSSVFDRITDTASGTGAALRMQSGSIMILDFPATDTMVIGFRFRIGQISNVVTMWETLTFGSRSIWFRILADGRFQILRVGVVLVTGTFAMTTDVWTYLELKVVIHDSVGKIELRINGNPTPDIDFTGDTSDFAADEIDGFKLQGAGQNLDYDDFYLDDSAFHGDVFVETLVADGAGAAADWTPSAGSNFENVEELPPDDDTTYNESLTVTDKDRFTHGDLPANTNVVLGVQVSVWARKTLAGTRALRTIAYDGTTEGEGVPKFLGTDYVWYSDMFEDHPTDANPWTESEVNSAEFGYKVHA